MSETKNYTVVTNETLNFSSARQKYSFGKDQRFSLNLDKVKQTEFNYDLGNTLSNRKAGFGIGDRFKVVT